MSEISVLLTVLINNGQKLQCPWKFATPILSKELFRQAAVHCFQMKGDSDLSDLIQDEKFSIKKYDSEWNDYVDVLVVDQVVDKDKVRLLFESSTPAQVLYVTPLETDGNQSLLTSNQLSMSSPLSISENQSIASQNEYEIENIPAKMRPYCFGKDQAYDVKSILQTAKGGNEILANYTNNSKVSFRARETLRKRLIRLSRTWLMDNCLKKDAPTPSEKARMAYSIQCEFSWWSSAGPLKYEHIYDPLSNKGYLESSVHNRRFYDNKTTKQQSRKRSLPVQTSPTLTDDQENLKIREVNRLKPGDSTTNSKIFSLMEELIDNRQAWIEKEDPSITDIIRKYERFGDTSGLIEKEFYHVLAKLPNVDIDDVNICELWETVAPIIVKEALGNSELSNRAFFNKYDIDCDAAIDRLTSEQQSLLAMMVFPSLAKPVAQATKRGSEKRLQSWSPVTALSQFIRFEKCGSTMEEVIKGHKSDGIKQPYLIALTIDGQFSKPDQTFLILDYDKIEISGTVTKALELIFMSFYAFNVEYPPSLCNMYQVMEMLFGIRKRRSKGAGNPGAQNVYINLKNKMDVIAIEASLIS